MKAIVLIVVSIALGIGGWMLTNVEATEPPLTSLIVTNVVDGDTIKIQVDGKEYTVRYIGIDTPETVHPQKPVEYMGKEASAKNKELVYGKAVKLESDVQDTDKYGRLLRYVWLDGIMINAELVRLGYATVATYPPNVKYTEIFLKNERLAREAGVGLWK